MNCDELVEAVTDYLEGALTPEEAAEVDRHLEVCDGCVAYVQQIRETIRVTGHLDMNGLSLRARESLLQAFRSRGRT
jgi:anti-sigma factor RsiW